MNSFTKGVLVWSIVFIFSIPSVFEWTAKAASSSIDDGISKSIDGSSNIYASASIQGTTDFEPNTAAKNYSNAGNINFFTLKSMNAVIDIISIDAGILYSQDFNSYLGTSNTIPQGWSVAFGATQVFKDTGNGSSSTGGAWAYGSSPDFSFGALRSGTTGNITLSVNFINNSGTAIEKLTLSWNYEQWRYANTSGFNVSGTGALAGNADLDALDFAGVSSGTNGVVSITPILITLTNLNIADGEEFGIMWVTTDVSGGDNGISIDDFSLTVNFAPVLASIEGTALNYTENDQPTIITGTTTISDADDADIESAVIQITGNYQNGEDVLSFTNQNGITGNFTPATGMMTLTGTSSLANYQTALREVKYSNTSDNPNTSTRTVSFTVNDGDANSSTVNRQINITAINDPPVLASIEGTALNYTENDQPTIITGTTTISDADDANIESAAIQITGNYQNGEDVLSFTNQNGITGNFTPATGMMTLTGTSSLANYQTALREVKYSNTSDNPNTSTRTVSFTVNDGDANSNVLTRDINIIPVNDTPVLADIEGFALNYTENDQPTIITGTTTISDADDADIESAVIQITGNYQNGEDVLSFTNQNGITGNFTPATGMMTLTGTSSLANYQTALREVKYFNTSDNPNTSTRTVSFTVNDGDANSNTVNRQINITAINDPPVLAGMEGTALNYTENDQPTIITGTITISDADDADIESAVIQITGNYQNGEDVLSFTNQNGITGNFTPATGMMTLTGTSSLANYQTALREVKYSNTSDNPNTSTRTVSFTVNDGDANSSTVNRQINITPVNDPPFLQVNNGTITNEGESVTISNSSLLTADADNAASEITYTITALPVNGILYLSGNPILLNGNFTQEDINNNLITYTHNGSETTNDFFLFDVNDPSGEGSAEEIFNITIIPVNDPPFLSEIENTILSYEENENPVQITNTIKITDADDVNIESATIQISSNYQENEDILIFDALQPLSGFKVDKITGIPLQLKSKTNFINQNGIISKWNASEGKLTLSGTASLHDYQSALRSIKYYNYSDNPSAEVRVISFIVYDGEQNSNTISRSLSVTPVNDPPVISPTADIVVRQLGAVSVEVNITDPENDPITINVSSSDENLIVNYENNHLLIDHTENWRGEGVITISASDGMDAANLNIPVFVNIPQITTTVEGNGSILPGGFFSVSYGDELLVKIIADSGHSVSEVYVDNIFVGAVEQYFFSNINSDHSIKAKFIPNKFKIISRSNDYGTIFPNGIIQLLFGTSQYFNITPDKGFFITDVLIDSQSIGPVSSYTFNNINSDRTIEAIFGGLKLLFPSGGETFEINDTLKITWENYEIEKIDIQYSTNDGKSWETIITNYDASSLSFDWLIPPIENENTKIKIIDSRNPQIFSISSKFKLGALRVVSPNGGEVFNAEANHDLHWISGKNRYVQIEFSADAGKNWKPIATVYTYLSAERGWQIPFEISDSCLIRVSDPFNAGIFDVSDDFFSIRFPLPQKTELLSPLNNSSDVTLPIIFNWNNAKYADSYNFHLSKKENFSSVHINESVNENNFIANNLAFNTDYYWRVRSVNSSGNGSWSNAFSFRTVKTLQLSGYLQYEGSGGLFPLNEFIVSLDSNTGGDGKESLTDDSGFYKFDGFLSGTYEINLSPPPIWSAVTASDILLIVKYLYGFAELDTLQILAADADNNGMINNSDLQLILQRYVFLIDSFPNGKSDWVFLFYKFFGVDSLPVDSKIKIEQDEQINIASLITGDVNKSYRTYAAAKSNYRVSLHGEIKINKFDEFELPLIITSGSSIAAASIIINYQPVFAEFVDLKVDNKFKGTFNLLEDGIITGAWINDMFYNDDTGSNELTIKLIFKAKEGFDKDKTFQLNVSNLSEVVDLFGKEPADISIIFPVVKIDIPVDYNIEQNYPNPFNPVTTIKFGLPVKSKAMISIYNMLGEKVETLLNRLQEEGYHEIKWNAMGYSSGVYFLVMNAESFDGQRKYNSVKKMILLR